MTMRLFALAGLSLSLLLAPGHAATEATCQLEDTFGSCWVRFDPAPAKSAQMAAEQTKSTAEKLKSIPTGLDTGGLSLGSNTKDFLPLLALSGLFGDASKDDDTGNLIFDLNPLLPWKSMDEGRNMKLKLAVNTEPSVSQVVEDALPESGRDEAVKSLEGDLGGLADYTISYSYNFLAKNLGRGPEKYRDEVGVLLQAIEDDMVETRRASPPLAITDPYFKMLEDELVQIDRDLADSLLTDAGNLSFARFRDLWLLVFEANAGSAGEPAIVAQVRADQKMRELISATERAAKLARKQVKSQQQMINRNGLNLVASLLNNMPQFHLTIAKRFREEALLGGDEESFKATYEWSGANLHRALKNACSGKLLQEGGAATLAAAAKTDRATCLSDFSTFVSQRRKSIESGHRFSFSAEYVDIESVLVSDDDLSLSDLEIAGSNKLVVSVGWARLFGSDGSTPTRLDLLASYEDVSDDPMRQDRGIASLTVTRKFGDLTIPFGIVYANHSQYLTDVDEVLSTHIGIKFSMNTGSN